MRVLIIGLNHQIQRFFGSSDRRAVEFVQDQKELFSQMLREEIENRQIEFVGEEANHREESIAESVCNEKGCQYKNVEMSPEERDLYEIPPGHADDPAVSDDEKARGNREREDYMVKVVLTEAKDSKNILILCGRAHSDALAIALRTNGHSVETDDLLNHSWYIEDWMSHILHDL